MKKLIFNFNQKIIIILLIIYLFIKFIYEDIINF